MLIPLKEIIKKYNLTIKGVVQAGAHWSEEHHYYEELGIKNFVYIEPCKEAYDKLCMKFITLKDYEIIEIEEDKMGINLGNIILYLVACGEVKEKCVMHISHNNQGQSNSLLAPKLHLKQHPEVIFSDYEIVQVIPLDKLVFKREDYNLLVMDVQGAELMVLKGAAETLKHIDIVYSEINTDETYENCAKVWELDDFLKPYGFERVETFMPSPNWSWGDAIYLKKLYYTAVDFARDNNIPI